MIRIENKINGSTEHKGIILFDGTCNLCRATVSFIHRVDSSQRKFHFVPLQSEDGRVILKQAGLGEDYNESIVYFRKGKPYMKSTAVLMVCKDLGGIRSALYILIIIPRFLRDAVYDLISSARHNISGSGKNCKVP